MKTNMHFTTPICCALIGLLFVFHFFFLDVLFSKFNIFSFAFSVLEFFYLYLNDFFKSVFIVSWNFFSLLCILYCFFFVY